jgi:hypothetical protein
MPLPKPTKNQKQSEFVSKCMGDAMMNKDFPDQKQRAAVCYSQFKRKSNASESLEWEDCADETFIIY